METKEKIEQLMDAAVVSNLDGIELFAQYNIDTIRESYNGIGPEFFPAELRAKVTEHLAIFEPAALLHDLRNEFSDGTRWSFNYANYEFHENCLRLANRKYPWYSWRRYAARHVAHLLYKFVSGENGWRAWIEAKERHAKKMQKKDKNNES